MRGGARDKVISFLRTAEGKAVSFLRTARGKVASLPKTTYTKTIEKAKSTVGLKEHEELEKLNEQLEAQNEAIKNATTAQEKFYAMQVAAQLKAQKETLQAERNRKMARTFTVFFAFMLFLAALIGFYLMYTGYAGPFSLEWRGVYSIIFSQIYRYIQPIWSLSQSGFADLQCALSNPLSCAALQQSSVTYSVPTFNQFTTVFPVPQSRDIYIGQTATWPVEITNDGIFGINTQSQYGGVSSTLSAYCASQTCSVLVCGNPGSSCSSSFGESSPQIPPGAVSFQTLHFSVQCPSCPNKIQWINETFCQNSSPFPMPISFNEVMSTSAAAMIMVPVEFIDYDFYNTLVSNGIPVPFSGPLSNIALSGPVQVGVNLLIPNPIISSINQIALQITISDADMNENVLPTEDENLYVLLPPGISAGSNSDYWQPASGAPSVGNFYPPSSGYTEYVATKSYLNATVKNGAPIYFNIRTNVPNNELVNGLPIIVDLGYTIDEIFPDYAVVVSGTNTNPCKK